jgi:hypothetical protein
VELCFQGADGNGNAIHWRLRREQAAVKKVEPFPSAVAVSADVFYRQPTGLKGTPHLVNVLFVGVWDVVRQEEQKESHSYVGDGGIRDVSGANGFLSDNAKTARDSAQNVATTSSIGISGGASIAVIGCDLTKTGLAAGGGFHEIVRCNFDFDGPNNPILYFF